MFISIPGITILLQKGKPRLLSSKRKHGIKMQSLSLNKSLLQGNPTEGNPCILLIGNLCFLLKGNRDSLCFITEGKNSLTVPFYLS